MLTSNDIEQMKQFLKEDGISEIQMPFIIEQIVSFVSIGYENFIKTKE